MTVTSSEASALFQFQQLCPPHAVNYWQNGEAEFYGAAAEVAKSLGLPDAPRTVASWPHGLQNPKVRLAQVKYIHGANWRDIPHLVANAEQGKELRLAGCKTVSEVGMPFIYARRSPAKQIAGSLLVMPVHSLPGLKRTLNEREYVRYISDIRRDFSEVVACLSRNCVENGLWFRAFERAGIPWVYGASGADRNALSRMATMIRSFESVTSNGMGSHVAYAAFCGCRTSISGPFTGFDEPELLKDKFYQVNPGLVNEVVREYSREGVEARCPELLVDPRKAVTPRVWAATELGEEFKREPLEIARILGWPGFGCTDVDLLQFQVCRQCILNEKLRSELQDVRFRLGKFEECILIKSLRALLSGVSRWYSKVPLHVRQRVRRTLGRR